MSIGLIELTITPLAATLIRLATGRLFTEKEIRSISSHAIGKHFRELFPSPEDELNAVQRVNEAQTHIAAAGGIISDMQHDLEKQSQGLTDLLAEIKEKKEIADKYELLAQTNEAQFSAFRSELEMALRRELETQSEKGRRTRQAISFSLWCVTLIVGAGLGAYFKDIITWTNTFTF